MNTRLSDDILLSKAIIIATNAHKGQVDKAGQPYILHPLRVMNKVKRIQCKIVAILHDVIEDSEVTLRNLIEEGFSIEVITAVDHVTRRKLESYTEFIERVALNRMACEIKLADLEDNMDIFRMSVLKKADAVRLLRYSKARQFLLKKME